MELISVIVPVYNAGMYLNRCIESIVGQTYKNLEIILVDDGSTDESPRICDEWAEKDSRIKVIHQENAGSGAARNAGLDAAKGEFIGFADSDDYISEDMYEHLRSLFTAKADIAECEYMEISDGEVLFDNKNFGIRRFAAENAMAEHIGDRFFRQLVWNKLYRFGVIGDIRFPEGKKIDDEFFTYRVLGNAGELVHSEKVCYAYRRREESVIHSVNAQDRIQAVEAKIQRHKYIEEKFPHLAGESIKNLWFTCIYDGQLVLREADAGKADAMKYLCGVLKKYPCVVKNCTVKEKFWLCLAKISLAGVCRLRNFLKTGL